jgi:hypothetical protein
LPAAHGLADFGDECAALAAMPEQFAGLVLVAAGFEPDDFDVQTLISGAEKACDLIRLRQRHCTLARADP